jgi:hypothetical protein
MLSEIMTRMSGLMKQYLTDLKERQLEHPMLKMNILEN